MGTLTARHLDGDRFCVAVREHELLLDQPVADGGENTAPTPVELFVASLAACVGHYAHRYLVRHGLSGPGLAVRADYGTATGPARVSDVTITVQLPDGVPEERLAALLAVASHCTVHNSLTVPPSISIALGQSTRPG